MAEKPSLEDYLDQVEVAAAAHPDWREGQTYFNVLRTMRPDLADAVHSITGTAADPFSVDRRLPAFLDWLEGTW